jgi:Arc/MetJ-type ribon-helix-helix transcriptional regulator
MSSGQERVSVRVPEDLTHILDDADSDSEAVREGLRRLADEKRQASYARLTDEQAQAYETLLNRVHGLEKNSLRLEAAKIELAQRLTIPKDLVAESVITPMRKKGYLEINSGMYSVSITVRPPGAVSDD